GPHACLWEQPQVAIDRMAFPRLLALAEIGWTPSAQRRWDDFAPRLARHYPRLDALGVAYARPRDADDLARTGLVADWDFPALTGFFREWFANEIIVGNGSYELESRIEIGADRADFQFCWVDDGREFPLVADGGDAARRVHRFTITDYADTMLYSIRGMGRGDGTSPCRGGLTLRLITSG
ncbi:MAG: hypothetical protein H0W72_13425, partial [Planctomycetes bacterium]|nr:hypothetical protein [Planctomycetota bacterium]